MRRQTRQLALSSMFLSVMMVLGYIETMIPLGGMPGIKLGLGNSVLLLSLYWLGIPFSAVLMLGKVFLSGFLFGNPAAMQYSLAGGVLSMLFMVLAIFGLKGISPVGAGVVGGVMHNVGQILVAMVQLQTASLMYYMAVLMIAGVVTGFLTGSVTKQLMRLLPRERKRLFMPEPESKQQ
ncbi:MAG: Gx transporter family protein [Eubacteriales bacterium]|jgi:heptaprenyl diphosphate synthase|nr:Gx transporter family protein [Eubacteriales bacterium]MDD4104796.1 Gx transporter family protein [Eubacteriales bacterium]MDD4709990.1 Gx transporter family protein [Eubacteriales bacterium]